MTPKKESAPSDAGAPGKSRPIPGEMGLHREYDAEELTTDAPTHQEEIAEFGAVPLPTFFELVTHNCVGHLQRAALY